MKKQRIAVESEDEKQKRSRVRRKKIQLRESQKKADTNARNVREVGKCCVFSMICGSAGSKNKLGKAAGAEAAVWRTVEKLHAAVARRTFVSQNVQNTACSNHFLKLGCGKIARHCSEKDIKLKCQKTRGTDHF